MRTPSPGGGIPKKGMTNRLWLSTEKTKPLMADQWWCGPSVSWVEKSAANTTNGKRGEIFITGQKKGKMNKGMKGSTK